MNINRYLMMGMIMGAAALRAEPPAASTHQDRREKNLAVMEDKRLRDNDHTLQAQTDLRKSTEEMSGHVQQQWWNGEYLRSVESQVTAGKKQELLAYQSYKETALKYGS